MRSLGRLAILTEELTLQYSPIILETLSCMEQANACQPDSPALPQKEAPSQADGTHSHQDSDLKRRPNAAAEVVAKAAAIAETDAEGMMEGTAAAAAEAGVEALMAGSDAGSAAEAVRPVNHETTGHKGSPPSHMPPERLQAVQNRETTSVHSQATTAEQESNAACTSPLSSPGINAAAMTTSSSSAVQAALGAIPLPSAPTTTAASLKQVPSHASDWAHAAATTSAASAGAKAAAPEAEAVVVEAISAAAALVKAFPHLLDDLGEALGHQLRCATGELCLSSIPCSSRPPLPRALGPLPP